MSAILMDETQNTHLESRRRLKLGEKAARLAMAVKLILAVMKGIIGAFTGSTALMADALNSGTDVVVYAVSWLSLRLVQRAPDKAFQYGYYKVESLAALVISVFVIFFAVTLGLKGYEVLFTHSVIEYPAAAIAAASISAIVCFMLVKYLRKIGDLSGSTSLRALATDSLADSLSSIIVVIAVFLSTYNVPYAEGLVTLGIAALVFKVALETARDAVLTLLDVSPSAEISERIREIAESIPGVEKVKCIMLRRAGPVIMGDITVATGKSIDVMRAHSIAEMVEHRALEEITPLEMLHVHVEPMIPERMRVAVPLSENKGMRSRISENLARAPYLAFLTIGRGGVELEEIVGNKYRKEKLLTGLPFAKYLVEKKVDAVVTKNIGEVLFHALRDSYIEILEGEGDSLEQVVENIISNRLHRILEPTRDSVARASDKGD